MFYKCLQILILYTKFCTITTNAAQNRSYVGSCSNIAEALMTSFLVTGPILTPDTCRWIEILINQKQHGKCNKVKKSTIWYIGEIKMGNSIK